MATCNNCKGSGEAPGWIAGPPCKPCGGTGQVSDDVATLRAQLDAARAEFLAFRQVCAAAHGTDAQAALDAARADNARLRDVAGAAHGLVVALRKPDVSAWDVAERAVVLALNASGTDWLADHVRAHNGPKRIAELLVENERLEGEVERLTAREPIGLAALRDELARARRKFPGGARLVEALCEELGEAAREERPDAAGNREWLQVACVAMRLYEEGCPDAAMSSLLPALRALEAPARAVLVESGND